MDITSLGTDYASELASNALTNAKNSALTGRDLKNADDEELKDACKQFEEYFVEQIFKKALKSTTSLSGEGDGPVYLDTMKDYFQDQYAREIASSATETGQIGFASQLYEQMKRSQGITPEEALQRIAAREAEKSDETDQDIRSEETDAAEEA